MQKYIPPSSSPFLHSLSPSSPFLFFSQLLLPLPKTIRPNRIQIRMLPDLDPAKPDPDPVAAGAGSGKIRIWIRFGRIWIRQHPDVDPLFTGSSRSGSYWIWIRFIRIWIRLLPDLDPVAAGSRVFHGLNNPVQALTFCSLSVFLTYSEILMAYKIKFCGS